MLTIKNIKRIEGTPLHTTKAIWEVMNIEERRNDYIIRVRFNYVVLAGVKHPKWVEFKLLRYNEFESEKNEWRMYNDQNGNYVTLTKGLLDLKMFVGMLGGQLEHCYIKN
jgi:hypothetical protein